MSTIKLASNFKIFKEEFKTDTGLDYNEANMSLYIQYYNARMCDNLLQMMVIYKAELFPNSKLIQLSNNESIQR